MWELIDSDGAVVNTITADGRFAKRYAEENGWTCRHLAASGEPDADEHGQLKALQSEVTNTQLALVEQYERSLVFEAELAKANAILASIYETTTGG